MRINEKNIGKELERWFSKSILHYEWMNFSDDQLYGRALDLFMYDYKRYYPTADGMVLNDLLKRHELVGILLYRIAREYFLLNDEHAAANYSSLGTFLSGIEIYYSAEIGKGIKINHGLGTVVGARTKIGENVLLHHGVTFGDKAGKRPVVKDHVIIYAGAKILGGITIGNNAVIGANCVCFIDVPEGAVAAGIPARIIKK
jgi:serine O-acetyltransferase